MMKIFRLRKLGKNNSGIILIVVLWTLVILSMLAIGLGRSTNIELAMAKNAIGKVKAKYLAWAGIIYAIDLIQMDSDGEESGRSDTLTYCGVPKNDDVQVEEYFENKELKHGLFVISFITDDEPRRRIYGIQDEERKIHLNALTLDNAGVLIALMEGLDIDSEAAKTVAFSIVDWIDADSNPSSDQYGAEDDYYLSLTPGYQAKDFYLESMQELLLVRGVTKEILKTISPYITVFGSTDSLKVNFNTASATVLRAMAVSQTGPATNTDIEDAESLVDKIIEYRRGDDQIEYTEDDKEILRIEDINPNPKEQTLFLSLNKYSAKKSDYLRIHVQGVEDRYNIKENIEVVVQRSDLSIIYWKR